MICFKNDAKIKIISVNLNTVFEHLFNRLCLKGQVQNKNNTQEQIFDEKSQNLNVNQNFVWLKKILI